VEFCGAPPEGSLACRICVYGKTRRRHVESIQELFKACKFDVLSPSDFTLKLWRKAIDLPISSQGVHPHWQLVPGRAKSSKRRKGSGRKCIHVAFVGFTSPNKGWPLFSELVQHSGRDPRYKFFHFSARDTPTLPSVTHVRSEVTPIDRCATQRLLAAKAIDLVLMLSPWPETFSFVAHEAIAAGAKIICLSDSGNVAELVSGLECGQILQDGAALVDFFDSGSAVSLVKKTTRPPPTYDVVQVGTTATVKNIEQITAKAAP
jgi:glycosyltransferase involved in cell wall biosynthesis